MDERAASRTSRPRRPPVPDDELFRFLSGQDSAWLAGEPQRAAATRAPSAGGVESSERSVIVAVTGPSDTSSYQPALPRSCR